MDQDLCVEFAIRSAIMDLLTEAQIARLCAGTGLVPLMSGDEYLDLLRLDLEVQCVRCGDLPCGTAIPRRAVHAQVWREILAQLSRVPELTGPMLAHRWRAAAATRIA